jgi:hypothetical protein
MRRWFIFFVLPALVLSGCQSSPSPIWVTPLSDTVFLYYIPATEWKSETNCHIRLDITYITEEGRPAVCNISFFGENGMPGQITAPAFAADGKRYPLRDVRVLVSRPEKNERRITSNLSLNELQSALNAQSLTLSAVLDGAAHIYKPPKEFFGYADQFLAKTGK